MTRRLASGTFVPMHANLVMGLASVVVITAATSARSQQANVAGFAVAPELAPSSPSLSWVRMPGAETCVTTTQLARAIESRLERRVFVSAAEADIAVDGRAEHVEGLWRAIVHVTAPNGHSFGERVLESRTGDCDALGELVAVAVALMIDPLTAPERAQVVEQVLVEVPVPVEVPGPRWRFEFDASLVMALGLLPTLAPGGVGALVVEPPGFVPVVFEGVLMPFSRAEHETGHVDFLHVHGGLQICPLWVRAQGLALHACVGADLGAVVVIGGDLDLQQDERVLGQAHILVRGHWDVGGPWTLRAALHLLVPFRHEPFVFGSSAIELWDPSPVAGMLDLGIGLHF